MARKPYVKVTMVDGKVYKLAGKLDDVSAKLADGPLVTLEDINGSDVLINTEHVSHAQEQQYLGSKPAS